MNKYDHYLAKILECVELYVDEGVALNDEMHLVDEAGLDSAALTNVLIQLEVVLGIDLSATDLSFDHFHSCRTLAEYFSNEK